MSTRSRAVYVRRLCMDRASDTWRASGARDYGTAAQSSVGINWSSTVANCGPALRPGAAGLANFVAAGAVSVVVVPDGEGPETNSDAIISQYRLSSLGPTSPGHYRTVCCPTQFVRLCQFFLLVRAHVGYTRVLVQDEVEQRLATWLHVLTGGEHEMDFRLVGRSTWPI